MGRLSLEHGMIEIAVDTATVAQEALGYGIHVRNPSTAGMLPDFANITSNHAFAIIIFRTAWAVHDPAFDATFITPVMTSVDPATVNSDMGTRLDGSKQQVFVVAF